MAANTKNKFPADKAGTKYGNFRNTRRFTQHKPRAPELSRQPAGTETPEKTS